MGLDGDHLLKRLRPVAAPASSAPAGGTRGAFGLDGAFARLIRLAESDQLDSQRPVDSPSTQLSEEQLQKIGRACDSLESAGLDDGLVLLGGRAFVVDVAERSIRQELEDSDSGVVQSLGGVVLVEALAGGEADGDRGSGAPLPPLSANTAFHPDLVRARLAGEGPARAS